MIKIRREWRTRRRLPAVSWWRSVLVIVVPVVMVTAAAVLLLVRVLDTGSSTGRLELIRTALAVGAGTGAIMTLVLAWRRQQATEHDAAERRLTELYLKAVEQLGSERAAVRHGALYALERVAQDNPDHRQVVVDVLCAYLRAPFTPPPDTPGARRLGGVGGSLRGNPTRRVTSTTALRRAILAPPVIPPGDELRRQEREVRLTAQHILARHLNPGDNLRRPVPTFWPDIDLDLTDAVLIDLDLTGCHVRTARFAKATFTGHARFDEMTFGGVAWFDRTTFTGEAHFVMATFTGVARFDGATFTGKAVFVAAFDGGAVFDQATFADHTRFGMSRFTHHATFLETVFTRLTQFDRATFTHDARFNGATFGEASFASVTFDYARFDGARLAYARFDEARFLRSVRFDEATFIGVAHFTRARFHARPKWKGTSFEHAPVMTGALVQRPPAWKADQGPWDWPIGWTTAAEVVAEPDGSEWFRVVTRPVAVPPVRLDQESSQP